MPWIPRLTREDYILVDNNSTHFTSSHYDRRLRPRSLSNSSNVLEATIRVDL